MTSFELVDSRRRGRPGNNFVLILLTDLDHQISDLCNRPDERTRWVVSRLSHQHYWCLSIQSPHHLTMKRMKSTSLNYCDMNMPGRILHSRRLNAMFSRMIEMSLHPQYIISELSEINWRSMVRSSMISKWNRLTERMPHYSNARICDCPFDSGRMTR
jgi:hypothetical protein